MYTSRDGEITKPVPVHKAESKECPVSVVIRKPDLDTIVDQILEAEFLHTTTGSIEYGADSSKWPAIWSDFVAAAAVENFQIAEARRLFKVI